MRSDRDTLDSAGEVGQPPVLFCCSLLVVRGSFLRPYGRIVGADLQPLRPPLAGQLPYKGSLGRPAVIFDHSLFRMMARRTAAANG